MERMRVSYEDSMPSFLEIFMDAEGLSDLLARVERLNSMLEYALRIRVNNERVDPLSGNLLSTPTNMMIIE